MKSKWVQKLEQQDFEGFYDPEDEGMEPLNMRRKADSQLDNMIGEIPKKKQHNFELTGKYSGKKASSQKYQQQYEDEPEQEYQQDEEQYEQDQSQKQQNNYNEYRTSKKIDSNLLEERIKQINDEDQQFVKAVNTQEKDPHQAQALKNQFNLYQKLLEIRYNFERNLQQIKKFPYSVLPYSEQLNQQTKQTEYSTIKTLESLYNVQKNLYSSAFGKQIQQLNIISSIGSEIKEQNISQPEYLAQRKLDVVGLYSLYQESANTWKSNLEQSLIKWSNKTALLTQSKNSFQSLLMQTPIGQAQKIFTSSLDKLLAKARLKRTTFKILFQDVNNIKQSSHPQIYDDQDFFYELSKLYENKINKDDVQEEGLLLGDTRKYLMQRNNKQKQKKQVDRRASKHRKIRYNVHAKLLNFSVARENPHVLQARDQIVKNIFNSAPKDNQVDYLQF